MSIRARLLPVVFASRAAPGALGAGPVYNVNSTADVVDANINGVCSTAGSVCTLRAAVMEASYGPNPTAEEVTINVPAGTYNLTIAPGVPDDGRNGDYDLLGRIRVQGAGRDKTILDGQDVDRLFHVAAGATVTIADMTIQNGFAKSHSTLHGGGIYSEGSLTVLQSLLVVNEVPDGWTGGGIYSAGTLVLTDTEIGLNHATTGAGGVFSSATATVTRAAIHGNTSQNAAGWYQSGSFLYATNTTFSSNHANSGAPAFTLNGVVAHLNNVTIALNDCFCGNSASAISIVSSSVDLSNSILYNTALLNECVTGGSTFVSNGYNIIRNVNNCDVTGAHVSSDPLLAGLAKNGGYTQTQAIPANSPATDGGPLAGCKDALAQPNTTDQRGVKRPIGTACDLGAFEVELKGDADGDGNRTVSDVFWLINYLFAGGPPPRGRANVNGDANTDVGDVFYLINFLFASGPAPV